MNTIVFKIILTIFINACVLSACAWSGKDMCDNSSDCLDDYYCNSQGRCFPVELDAPCRPVPLENDRCDAHSVCVDTASNGEAPVWRCQRAIDCPSFGVCSDGICNNHLLLGKAKICLPQRCFDNGNCSGADSCALVEGGFGLCHSGQENDPCTEDEHCWGGFVCAEKNASGLGTCLRESDLDCAAVGGSCTSDYCPSGTHLTTNACPDSDWSCCR